MNVFHQRVWNPDFTQFSSLFFPIMPYGSVFSKFKEWPKVGDLNQFKPNHVNSFLSHIICFVEQKASRQEKCFSSLYEPRIFLQGEVNTRPHSWHDFFNAMIWYAFPKTKATLNMRQFIAFDERADFPWKNPLKNRVREQDLLTMFDEGGCILVNLIGENKGVSIPFLFGHGFYERIVYGDTDLSACTLFVDIEASIFEQSMNEILFAIDSKVSQVLADRNYYKKEGAFQTVHIDYFLKQCSTKVSVVCFDDK